MTDRQVEKFTISSLLVVHSNQLRLDATAYNTEVVRALNLLEELDMELRTLGEITETIFMPGRFKRTYVEDSYGVPFLQGSHIVQLQPTDVKYLSRAAHKKNLGKLIIHSGWLLITRSGSTGRVAIVPPEWDGWAASEHLFRVVPKDSLDYPVGYICAFLISPLGQVQLNANVYGAVVDELTVEHIQSIRIPVPRTQEQQEVLLQINELVATSVALRAEAVSKAQQADSVVALLLQGETSTTSARLSLAGVSSSP